jgi:hypothetical protein
MIQPYTSIPLAISNTKLIRLSVAWDFAQCLAQFPTLLKLTDG